MPYIGKYFNENFFAPPIDDLDLWRAINGDKDAQLRVHWAFYLEPRLVRELAKLGLLPKPAPRPQPPQPPQPPGYDEKLSFLYDLILLQLPQGFEEPIPVTVLPTEDRLQFDTELLGVLEKFQGMVTRDIENLRKQVK